MLDPLFVGGVLLPLRTGATLVAALAAGILIGASGRTGTGSLAARELMIASGLAAAGAAAGLALPRLASADRLTLAATGAAMIVCAVVVAARVPARASAVGAIAGITALLAAQAAFARFLPGELPVSVHAGASLGLGLTVLLPALVVRAARAHARGAELRRASEIGTRVLGSWIGAVALLMLALALVPR